MAIKYVTSITKVEECLKVIAASKNIWIPTDTEGTGLDPHTSEITLVQLCNDDDIYLLDVRKAGKEKFTKVFNEFLNLCKKEKKIFVIHNFKYDVKMFWKHGIDFTGQRVVDTMLAARIIECGLSTSVSLLEVTERYLGVELDKTEQKSDWSVNEFSKEQLKYAANDVFYLTNLAKILLNELKENNLIPVFNLEMRAVYGFAAMEYYGLKLDLDRLARVKPWYEDMLENAHKEFLSYVPERYIRKNLFDLIIDEGIEPSSPSQVLKVLQDLKVPNPLYNPKSSDKAEQSLLIPSTGTPLLSMLDLLDYPIVDSLLRYRKANKLLTSYIYNLPKMINPITGRLHTSFNQIVTTGRSSSSDPNLNQLPRPTGKEPLDENGQALNIRSCFVAEEGYKFALADMSQIELRVMASVCKDANMLEEFAQKKDPYASTAALINDWNYYDIVVKEEGKDDKIRPEFKKDRQKAKAVRLGFNYVMGAAKFRNYAHQQYGVIMTLKESEVNRRKYFDVYPGLTDYHNAYKDKSILEVFTLPPFNRRRLFEEYPGISALVNHPVQGTASDIQKLAIATIYEELHAKGFSPTQSQDIKQVLTVHDELELETTLEHSEYAAEMLERNMVEAGEYVIKDCPILAEAMLVDNLAQKE